ncbi:MAG: SDR family NAD(P)-dependent oxidoreductase, partial [Desulfobacterales bacterium]|nr:SDR family NAD(P)-dependent oxidoreductase [Desulfobacterales bacterium]
AGPAAPAAETHPGPGKQPAMAASRYMETRRRRLPADPAAPLPSLDPWLIFMDSAGLGRDLADALERRGRKTARVEMGPGFAVVGENAYTVNPGSPDDYDALLRELAASGEIPPNIVHLWTAAPDPPPALPPDPDLHALDPGFYSLLFLARALGKRDQAGTVKISAMTTHLADIAGESPLDPAKAAMLGPLLVIPEEYPHIQCRCIDIGPDPTRAAGGRAFIRRLLAEIGEDLPEPVTALREGWRWVRTFQPVKLAEPKENKAFREKGVYLITGGLGGVGLALARYLAETVKARLVLTGRTALPPRETWRSAPDAPGREESEAVAIQALLSLEDQGAEVMAIRADVTDPDQMREALARAEKRFGRIHGVVHAAGVAGGGLIQLKTREMARETLAPKITGALVLTRLLDDRPLDFILFCSSIASIIGEFGQVDYSAANAFLDALALDLRKRGVPAVSINWDAWQVGMAADPDAPEAFKALREENLPFALTPQEGAEAFARVAAASPPRVAASPRELDPRLRKDRRRSLEILEAVSRAMPMHPRPDLTTEYIPPGNETEEALARIWSRLLGVERVGARDDFFELGGHSLLAMQILSRAREEFQAPLPPTAIFENPTIAALAREVITRQLSGVGEEELEGIMAEAERC